MFFGEVLLDYMIVFIGKTGILANYFSENFSETFMQSGANKQAKHGFILCLGKAHNINFYHGYL